MSVWDLAEGVDAIGCKVSVLCLSCVAKAFHKAMIAVMEAAAITVLGSFQFRVFCFSGMFQLLFEECELWSPNVRDIRMIQCANHA
jgi:hypothetical protein